MRTILALTLVLLGANGAAPENYSVVPDQAGASGAIAADAPDASDSAAPRGDRLDIATPTAGPMFRPTLDVTTADVAPETMELPAAVALLSPVPESLIVGPDSLGRDSAAQPRELPIDELCQALLSSAQNNDLPVPFFANLIWQESRLRDDVVSRAGAVGIAQFMPEVAVETGLDDPFDPLQALPASARLLRILREHFGNLGFVAAAYNAGAHRVSEWLQHHRALPRETRDYVVKVTGRSAEQWRNTPVQDDALTFVQHLPCRGMPAFADIEQVQQQTQAAQAEQAAAAPLKATAAAPAAAKQKNTAEPKVADQRHSRGDHRRGHLRFASRDTHEERHHAVHRDHAAAHDKATHDKYRSAHREKARSKAV